MDTVLFQEERVIKKNDLLSKVDTGVREFILSNLRDIDASTFYWDDTIERDKITKLVDGYKGYGNVHRINDIPRINKFFERVNQTLNKGDYYVMCMETKDARRTRILNKYPRFLSRPYYMLDFLVKRVLPKWNFTKKIYFWITKGRNRVISLTEGLGRLVSCGFEIIGYQRVGYKTFILTRKVSEPAYDMQPTYGALVKLRRVGKDGKLFNVYKLRTMHPYSEYIQDFTFKRNSLQSGGKIKDDFRITGWGKVFRKLWIDELPMFINFFKGQMKLVGIRPLSKHFFNLYPEDLQQLRTKVKPGLLPPFYADLPQTLEEIIDSERRYLHSYLARPLRTDIKYFFRATYNILIKRARSN
ncbi:MAG: sugar transferase [Balneola sp.]|jgi:lipopolysaccharide/colanic/teichoic acid biosynthesis glycosyltransferase